MNPDIVQIIEGLAIFVGTAFAVYNTVKLSRVKGDVATHVTERVATTVSQPIKELTASIVVLNESMVSQQQVVRSSYDTAQMYQQNYLKAIDQLTDSLKARDALLIKNTENQEQIKTLLSGQAEQVRANKETGAALVEMRQQYAALEVQEAERKVVREEQAAAIVELQNQYAELVKKYETLVSESDAYHAKHHYEMNEATALIGSLELALNTALKALESASPETVKQITAQLDTQGYELKPNGVYKVVKKLDTFVTQGDIAAKKLSGTKPLNPAIVDLYPPV